jgi:hypothetical protein
MNALTPERLKISMHARYDVQVCMVDFESQHCSTAPFTSPQEDNNNEYCCDDKGGCVEGRVYVVCSHPFCRNDANQMNTEQMFLP